MEIKMTAPQGFMIPLFIVSIVLLLIADELYRPPTVQKLKKMASIIKRNPAISSAVSAVIILLSIYLSFVGFGEKESIGLLGQTGDYFGGILNPIFAFISVVLLLLTYKQALKNTKSEHERIEREEIRSLINESKNNIEKLKSKKDLLCLSHIIDDDEKKYLYFSINEVFEYNCDFFKYKYNAHLRSCEALASSNLLDAPDHDKHSLDRVAIGNNVSYIARIRSLTITVLDLYIDYLKTQKSQALVNLMRADFTLFIMQALEQGILSESLYHEYTMKFHETDPRVTITPASIN